MAAHLRYGVDTPLAVALLVRDVKSRSLARDLGRLAEDSVLDDTGLREYLIERHIQGWRAEFGATPTDILDLLQFVQGGDRHKLGEMMATGTTTAQIHLSETAPKTAVSVNVVPSANADDLRVQADNNEILGIVSARDHSGVAAVLESGLLLDFTLQDSTLTITRADAGQLSFL